MSNPRCRWRFLPRLERCEPRDCPSVSATIQGSTLVVSGDAGDDTVSVTVVNGKLSASIAGSGGNSATTGTGVNAVRIDTSGGNDAVAFKADGSIQGDFALAIDVGSADDTSGNRNSATVEFDGYPTGATVSVSAVGGAVRDTLIDSAHLLAITITSGTTVGVTLAGNGGADVLLFEYSGLFDGRLNVSLDGGSGNDTILTRFAPASGGIDPINASFGSLTYAANGGSGNDRFGVTVYVNNIYSAVILGGSGADTALTKGKLKLIGIENVMVPTPTAPSPAGVHGEEGSSPALHRRVDHPQVRTHSQATTKRAPAHRAAVKHPGTFVPVNLDVAINRESGHDARD